MAMTEEGSRQHDVTVVIPAYKAEATIRRAVDSVLAQPGVNPRVVVVVDGKLDRTAELVSDYPRERVAVIEHPTNLGAAVSRNDGLAAAEVGADEVGAGEAVGSCGDRDPPQAASEPANASAAKALTYCRSRIGSTSSDSVSARTVVVDSDGSVVTPVQRRPGVGGLSPDVA